jgi:hypothetical protein
VRTLCVDTNVNTSNDKRMRACVHVLELKRYANAQTQSNHYRVCVYTVHATSASAAYAQAHMCTLVPSLVLSFITPN